MFSALVLAILLEIAPAESPKLRGEEIEALVDQLVSTNQAPTKLAPRAQYPEEYDRNAQKRVREAWHKLWAAEIQAFPCLVKHFDDRRYSFTAPGFFVDENWSVGKACSDIFKCYLRPFGYQPYAKGLKADDLGRPVGPLRPSYVAAYRLTDSLEAQKWLADRRDKSLRELQIEVLEWTIAEEAKNPDRYSEKEHSYLSNLLEKASKSDRPLPPSAALSAVSPSPFPLAVARAVPLPDPLVLD